MAALISMEPGSISLWRYFLYVKTGVGWVFGTAGLTGIFLLLLLMIMVACSLPCVRNKGFFEVNYLLWFLNYAISLNFIGVLLDP